MGVRILHGDCRSVLPTLADASVQCCVSSPPYFGLRDYGVAGQIGLEPSPDAYVAELVAVFREVRRVLREDGCVWLNLGSSYSTGAGSNITDQLNRLLEGGSVFFADTDSVAITSHRVAIAAKHERAPDSVFSGLLASQRRRVKERDENFCEVTDLFANPRCAGLSVASRPVVVKSPTPKMVMGECEHRPVVIPNRDPQPEAVFTVARVCGFTGEDDEATFAVNEADKPSVSDSIRWHSAWDTIATEALSKGVENIDFVEKAIALGDRPHTLAGLLCDFRVTKASDKQVALTGVHSPLTLAISDVGHLWFVLRCGSIIPYRKLLEDASRFANELLPKQDIGVPWRVARALQQDGWILRSSIIWAKPNPMPESVTDRPTSSHEHVFLLTKAARYFWDGEAVREGCSVPDWNNGTRVYGGVNKAAALAAGGRRQVGRLAGVRGVPPRHAKYESSDQSGLDEVGRGAGRNIRNVWTIATQPYSGSHFATMPPALAELCIKAGTSERGACPGCGAPWVRIITKGEPDAAHRAACGADASGGYNGQSTKGHAAAGVQDASAVKARILAGMRERISDWRQSCDCPPAPPVPCVVLDPFFGAGTTGLVADRLGRDCIGVELNPAYTAMAGNRVSRDAGLFAQVAAE